MATLGIDIGGTNLSLGLVENGKIIQEIHTPSFRPEMTLDETLDYLAAQIEKVFRAGTEKIGIGVPSVVDVRTSSRESCMTRRTSLPGRSFR